MILSANSIFVFDLDDTLYSEKEFEKSGIEYVCKTLDLSESIITILKTKKNWIHYLTSNYFYEKDDLLNLYRNHLPKVFLYSDAKSFINKLLKMNIPMSLITDGRSLTQRNKLKSLNLENTFKKIIISEEINSEKPSLINYELVMDSNHNCNYIYIGDNPKKDFLTPNLLGWTSVCLKDNGFNIHKQNFNIPIEYLPTYIINSFDEIILDNEI